MYKLEPFWPSLAFYLQSQTFPKRHAFVSRLERAIREIKYPPWITDSRNMERKKDAWRTSISALRTHSTMVLSYNNHHQNVSYWQTGSLFWSWRKASEEFDSGLWKNTCSLFFFFFSSGPCLLYVLPQAQAVSRNMPCYMSHHALLNK